MAAASIEIDTMSPIRAFTGAYRFLSNFYPVPAPNRIEYEGLDYATVEHGFQAAKTDSRADRLWIRSATAPGIAKFMGSAEGLQGRRIALRKDWEKVKLNVMLELLEQKFEDGTELAGKLAATGERELIEGNAHGDTYWGMCKGEGQNMLGKLLMSVREGLR